VTAYFVTGTDTGVGKTFVSAALLRRARERGLRTFGFKPIETGCDGPLGADQLELCEAAGGWQSGRLAGVYRLRAPIAPRAAAELEAISIDLDLVVSTFRETAETVDFSVLEGAGGWRVPLVGDAGISTLAAKIGAPIVVVARAGLGTINHSLLTIEAVERDGCSVAALVLSCRPEDDLDFARRNASDIARRWPGSVLVLDRGAGIESLVPREKVPAGTISV
jgi:dethiobiotin synthetase